MTSLSVAYSPSVGEKVDPQDVDRQQWNRQTHERRQKQRPHFAGIAGHVVFHELANVVVDATAFAHGGDNAGEIIVDYWLRVFRNG